MEFIQEAKEHFYKAAQGEDYSGKRRKEAKGEILPTLASQVDPKSIVSNMELGIREIRLDRIVGTYYDSRSNIFYDGFIPKGNDRTEFAAKWINLCAAQLSEGIRDPILVYEYLNNYYVQEGNKRVSVLKYFDAVSVTAEVIRLIPPYDEKNQEIKNYYAFLDFFDETNFEEIWFTKACRFQSLIDLMDKYDEKESYEDYLRNFYITFRRIYKSKIEFKYPDAKFLTTGDIFLAYCNMFSEDEIDEDSLRKRIGEVIKQCNADTLVEVDDQAGTGFLDKSVLQLFRKPKVAFVFPYSSQINGWAKDHWRSQVAMEELYAGQMTVDLIEDVLNSEDPRQVLDEAAQKYEVLFLIDCVLESVALQCSVDYPQTTFLLCSGIKSTYLLPSYYGKTYQTNFLLGLFGAMITDENRIGYISGDMNHQIYRSMRAFKDGFKSIRPKAKFQYVMKESDLDEDITFSAYYRSVVGSHLTEGTVNTFIKRREDTVYRAYTYWNWKKFYEGMLARILDGSFHKIRNSHNVARNRMFFHWGMGTDVIDIEITEEMPTSSSKMIFENIRDSIIDGSFDLSYLGDLSGYDEFCRNNR